MAAMRFFSRFMVPPPGMDGCSLVLDRLRLFAGGCDIGPELPAFHGHQHSSKAISRHLPTDFDHAYRHMPILCLVPFDASGHITVDDAAPRRIEVFDQ